jgi:transposase
MQVISYFVGLDVHKQVIAYCVKTAAGEIVQEGSIPERRADLDRWVQTMPGPWHGGMEATLFSHWIYRYLQPHAAEIWMGNPSRMKAISSGKKKSDKLDARTLADLLRANLFPRCFVISPELESLRRQMRFRRLLVQETVTFKNKTAGLLMEVGAEYERRRLHGKRYFTGLLKDNPLIRTDLRPLLKFNRAQIEGLQRMDGQILRWLEEHPRLKARMQALTAIPGVGTVTALTWALEVADPARFGSIKQAVSYCGFASALRESAGKEKHGPLSKQRNAHLQSTLIEAAKLAPRYNQKLKAVYEESCLKGSKNRATLAVARKLTAYLLAVDRAFFADQANSATTAA